MKYIYVFAAMCAGLALAYLAGGRIAREQCRADMVTQTVVAAADAIKIKRDINAKVYNTGVGDIRDRLREKYTIAD